MKKKMIWIVDDEKPIREMIAAILNLKNSKEKFDVKIFPDAIAAREALKKEFPPDILLTDYTMPKENGIELAKYFRDGFYETTVVLMSATLELISEERIKEAGIKRTLKKPFFIQELNEILG